jgi:hypothetical protein
MKNLKDLPIMAKDTHETKIALKYEGKKKKNLCQSPMLKEGYPGGAHWSTKVNDPQDQSNRSPKTNL